MPLEGRHTSKWLPYPYFLRKSPQRLSRATHEGFIDNPPPSVTVTDIRVSGSTFHPPFSSLRGSWRKLRGNLHRSEKEPETQNQHDQLGENQEA